ncbi:DNA/RNA non-specific endonuclease [Bdellovibrio sp. SKB1291214]|uniref:DNA/RNA non-specific endonuclease n=1 Tax=Bdellovibrio sp. SKB1291214 TaxID=1732569 RepID=UPI000B51AAD9|nr:DNA/RNA non-specific endonuclease [Bdellovibrio sp. SKB1291214]UYL09318.1 DNA/RNA non-specific endonuclease [Bdellovibrio sp. SKB1291214]
MITIRNKLATTILLTVYFSFSPNSFAVVEGVIGNVPLQKNLNVASQLPTTNAPEIIISRKQFVISYNKVNRAPNWASWELDPSKMGNADRTNGFSQDAELEEYLEKQGGNYHAVTSTEYRGTCFDRGHQVPSADRTDSTKDNEATFAMSNMIPQTPFLNRVLWEDLERYTRDLVTLKKKKAYIIAGPIYDQNFGAIGPNRDIPVPSKNFKIIFLLEPTQTAKDINNDTPVMAVIFPNTLPNGKPAPLNDSAECSDISSSNADWNQYRSTVKEVERLTGLNII